MLDKMFLIVGCPRCKIVQVVDGQFKTRSCASCGKRFEVEGLKVLGRAKDAREARELVSAVKARDAGQDQT